MKKDNIYKILYTISILLIIVFSIILGVDYFKYDDVVTSAPFYVCVIIRGLEFLLPSIIAFFVGLIFRRKYSK